MCLDHTAEPGLAAVNMGGFALSFPTPNTLSCPLSLGSIGFSLAQWISSAKLAEISAIIKQKN